MDARYKVYSTTGSAILVVGMRWTSRAIGTVSMVVLARLLAPEDFGVIALASLVVSLTEVLFDFGVHVALIQNRSAVQAHYDSAWTLRLLQASFATVALILLSPFATAYFQDPRLQPVLMFLAISVLLTGLENIGVVDFQKNMQFGVELRLRFIRRMSGFVVTLVMASIMRSYWALVAGMLTERAVSVVLSYILHTMRPRLSFEKFRDIFGISQWMLVYSIGRYFRRNLHRMLVGRWASTDVMGAYSIAEDISSLPTTEVLTPLNRALFPAFAKTKGSDAKLKDVFLLAQGVQTLLAVPAAIGLALIAEEAVLLLLGAKWQAATPFVEVLALVNIATALTTSGSYVLLALGKARINAFYVWAQVVLFGAFAVSPLIERTAIEVAWLRLAVVPFALCLLFALLKRSLPILTIRDVASTTFRPLAAAAAMAVAVQHLDGRLDLPLWVTLVVKIGVGAAVYVGVVALLWFISGRRRGAESLLIEKARAAWESGMPYIKRHLRGAG